MEMMNFEIIKYKDAKICILDSSAEIDDFLNYFESDKYAKEVEKMSSQKKRREFISVRYALKMCLNGEEKEVLYTSKGKPFLADCKKKISISHTKNRVAVIVNNEKSVGIDIEKPTKKLLKVAERFLSDKELERYQNMSKKDGFNFLKIIWSAKESIFKIVGDAYNFAEQLYSLPFEVEKEGELILVHTDKNRKYRVKYLLNENYTLTYCVVDE